MRTWFSRHGIASTAVIALTALALGSLGSWALWQARSAPALDAVTTHGEWVQIPAGEGRSIRAYVAYPERADKAPAIIVIHEIYGLTDWEPTVADRFAANGYVAVLPDLLSGSFGQTPADGDSARKLVAGLTPALVTADLDAVYHFTDTLPAVAAGQIATIGFCWGGSQSFRYATSNPKLRAAVVCYGSPPDSAALARVEAPVLGIYAENDARINQTIPATAAQLSTAGKTYLSETFPGTGHGFLKPGRRGHDSDQTGLAWAKILGFLDGTFRQ